MDSKAPAQSEVIILAGRHGTKKTVTACELSKRLGWDVFNPGDLVRSIACEAIPTLFHTPPSEAARELLRISSTRALLTHTWDSLLANLQAMLNPMESVDAVRWQDRVYNDSKLRRLIDEAVNLHLAQRIIDERVIIDSAWAIPMAACLGALGGSNRIPRPFIVQLHAPMEEKVRSVLSGTRRGIRTHESALVMEHSPNRAAMLIEASLHKRDEQERSLLAEFAGLRFNADEPLHYDLIIDVADLHRYAISDQVLAAYGR